ncbi:hypothetical protein GQ53DRAFT_14079 [Thozetella sp. PMI_491]|nr:hypothetical protein GQ53DRAFT_14079 [Thozetella sp. PMI_491]
MDSLEGKMDQLLQQLSPAAFQPIPPSRPAAETVVTHPQLSPTARRQSQRGSAVANLIPEPSIEDEKLLEVGRSYLNWCHRQPFSFFQEDGFLESLKNRDREVILALQSVCMRLSPEVSGDHRDERILAIATVSRRLVMSRLAQGKVELSTLQTLCLLSLVDFLAGRPAQADLNLSITAHLIHTLVGANERGSSVLIDSEELRNCIQTVQLLQNLQSPLLSTAQSLFSSSPSYSSKGRAHIPPSSARAVFQFPPENASENDMLPFIMQLSEVWRLARAYALSQPDGDTPPPWTPQSDYSSVMERHFDIDSRVPMKFRWQTNRFHERDLEELQRRREYWSQWLYLQFVYAAIPCLLNHPFLLSMRLRNFRHTMPHSFIQQSFEQITRHAGWISYFVDLLEKKGFVVMDPVLAHCVVIVATIHLQHSFVVDDLLRDKARLGFDKCMNFLRKMSRSLPTVQTMVSNLERLQKSVVTTLPSDSHLPITPQVENAHTSSADAALLWDLLVYERAGCNQSTSDTSLFGESLLQNTTATPASIPGSATDASFDLIGTAGIYGHKTAPQATPYYPPNESGTPLGKDDYARYRTQTWFGLEGAMNGVEGQDDLFLFASEYGKAIESWLDFEAPLV